jgi:hypothetical protein
MNSRYFRLAVVVMLLGLVPPSVRGQSQGSSPNDRARFLAALPIADTSLLKKFEQLLAYREQSEMLAAKWQEVQKKRWDLMTSWVGAEVKPHITAKAPLFYMFGGPDFLSAHLLYPDAQRYILCGLETIGRVPPMETWSEAKATNALHMIGAVLKPALDQGFFITKEMGGNLLKSEAYGVLPLLYVFVVRTGNQITSVEYVGLSATGELQNVTGDDPVKAGARGVRITFVRNKNAAPQELYYFRTDLSDKAVQADKRFLLYLGRLGQANSYLKAASYLMHQKEFSMIRDLLLAQSTTILQDDSGLPYRAFDPMQWKITLYGNYIGPISEISWAEQRDLRKAYAVPGAVKPLPFKSGYGKLDRANLLFAIRNSPPRSTPK